MYYYYHPESDSVFKEPAPIPEEHIFRDDLTVLDWIEYIDLSVKFDTNHEDTLL